MRAILLMVGAVVIVAAACGGDDADGVEAPDVSLSITFDGENCTYEGPTELKAGPVTIEFVSAVDEPAEGDGKTWPFKVNLLRHTGDETIQDMIDYIGPGPSRVPHPSWTFEVRPRTWDLPVLPGQTVTWEGNLEPGIYSMVCAEGFHGRVWFGTGLTVED